MTMLEVSAWSRALSLVCEVALVSDEYTIFLIHPRHTIKLWLWFRVNGYPDENIG
jgi:hypothetical protein